MPMPGLCCSSCFSSPRRPAPDRDAAPRRTGDAPAGGGLPVSASAGGAPTPSASTPSASLQRLQTSPVPPSPAAPPTPGGTAASDAAGPTATAAAPTQATGAPQPAPTCEVRIAPVRLWQTSDGAWHASIRAAIKNVGDVSLQPNWTLRLTVVAAVAVEKDWNWTSALTDGVWEGSSRFWWQSVGRQQTIEVGGDLRLSGRAIKVTAASINGRSCRLST